MINTKTLLLTSLFLASCTPSNQDTLENRLAGKSMEERHAILIQECSNAIAASDNSATAHTQHMKAVCEATTGHSLPSPQSGVRGSYRR